MTKLQSAVAATIAASNQGHAATTPAYELRDRVRAMVPAPENCPPTWGKKQIVAATVAAMLAERLDEIATRVALDDVAKATSWRSAASALAALGDAGVVLANGSLCCRVPCAPCAMPGWWTNWGLPNTQEVARRLLDWQ